MNASLSYILLPSYQYCLRTQFPPWLDACSGPRQRARPPKQNEPATWLPAGGGLPPLDANIENRVAHHPRGNADFDRLPLFPAEESLADRRLVADSVTVRIGFRGAYDHIG